MKAPAASRARGFRARSGAGAEAPRLSRRQTQRPVAFAPDQHPCNYPGCSAVYATSKLLKTHYKDHPAASLCKRTKVTGDRVLCECGGWFANARGLAIHQSKACPAHQHEGGVPKNVGKVQLNTGPRANAAVHSQSGQGVAGLATGSARSTASVGTAAAGAEVAVVGVHASRAADNGAAPSIAGEALDLGFGDEDVLHIDTPQTGTGTQHVR